MTTRAERASTKRQKEFSLAFNELVTVQQQKTGISYLEIAIVVNKDIGTTLDALNQNTLNPENKLADEPEAHS